MIYTMKIELAPDITPYGLSSVLEKAADDICELDSLEDMKALKISSPLAFGKHGAHKRGSTLK